MNNRESRVLLNNLCRICIALKVIFVIAGWVLVCSVAEFAMLWKAMVLVTFLAMLDVIALKVEIIPMVYWDYFHSSSEGAS